MSEYEHLAKPIFIGDVFVKNRIAMAPMNDLHQFYDPLEGTVNWRWIEYFKERAKGGVGLIITGVFKIEDEITHFRQNNFPTWALLSTYFWCKNIHAVICWARTCHGWTFDR
jgi:2-enoate reductase